MKTIIIKDSDITSGKIEVEYINWVCPNCGTKNSTMNFHIVNKEMICDYSICRETVKLQFEHK